MEIVWRVSGGCMAVYGGCLKGVLSISGRCLEGVWRESMQCNTNIFEYSNIRHRIFDI